MCDHVTSLLNVLQGFPIPQDKFWNLKTARKAL